MLEIATGRLKSLPLKSPKGSQTRPTSERTRQSLFNFLVHHLSSFENLIVCDLFAGSGALGIEAISQGASEVWFLDSHSLAQDCLRKNLTIVSKSLKIQAFQEPTLYLIKENLEFEKTYQNLPEFDLVFSDPPYNKGLSQKIIGFEEKWSRVKSKGLLVTECHESELSLIEKLSLKTLTLIEKKHYGETTVCFHEKI